MAEIISKDTIDRVRASLDIAEVVGSYIPLRQYGSSFKALCPFHHEKTPSFHVNPARQMFHCFGCGKGGDVFRFVMDYENVDFPTAVRQLAERAGVPIAFEGGGAAPSPSRSRGVYQANAEAARRFLDALLDPASPSAAAARGYLLSRSLPESAWREWSIGFAPDAWHFLSGPPDPVAPDDILDAAGLLSRNASGKTYDRFRNRIVFAIRNELGRVVAFSARAFLPTPPGEPPAPKYVNTNETPVFKKGKVLFGMDKAKRPVLDSRTAILCEGQIDCIRCHLAGFANTVASQGTAFTADHARLLRRYADRVVVVLDADAAGRKAALRTASILLQESLAVALAELPPGEDPDSLILKNGPDAFRAVVDAAASPVRFLLSATPPDALRNPASLAPLTREIFALAAHSPSDAFREQMLREAASSLALSYQSLYSDFQHALRRRRFAPAPGERPPPEPSSEAPAPGGDAPPPPPCEFDLAVLLGANPAPEALDVVREWIRYPLLVHPGCRAIVRALVEEGAEWLDALDAESDAVKALASRVMNTPSRLAEPEQQVQAARDFILRLWAAFLERKKADLAARRRAATPDARTALAREYADLLSDLRLLRTSWPDALPVLARLLDSVDHL